MSDKPARSGKRWTDEDNLSLLTNLERGVTIKALAPFLQRTVGSIKSRIELLSYGMHKEGMSHEVIKSNTKISQDDLDEAIRKYDYKEKNPPKKPLKKKESNNDFMNQLDIFCDLVSELSDKVDTLNAKVDHLIAIARGRK